MKSGEILAFIILQKEVIQLEGNDMNLQIKRQIESLLGVTIDADEKDMEQEINQILNLKENDKNE